MSQNKNLYRLFLLISCLVALGLFVTPYLKIVFQPTGEAVPEKISFVKNVPGFRLFFGGDLASFAMSAAPMYTSSQNPAGILQDLPAGAVMLEKFPWAALTCLPALLGIALAILATSSEMLTEYAVYLTGLNVLSLCSLMVPFMTLIQKVQTPALIANLQYEMHYRVSWGLWCQFGVALLQLGVAVSQYYYQRVKNARDKKMNLARFQFKKTAIQDNTSNGNPSLGLAAENLANNQVQTSVSYDQGPDLSSSPQATSPLMGGSLYSSPVDQNVSHLSTMMPPSGMGGFASLAESDLGPNEGNEEPFRLALPHEDLSSTEKNESSEGNRPENTPFLEVDQRSAIQRAIAQGSPIQRAIDQSSTSQSSIAQGSAIQRAIAQGSQAQDSPSQKTLSQGSLAQGTLSQGFEMSNPSFSTFANQRRQSRQNTGSRSSLAILSQTQLSKSLAEEAAKAASEIKLQDETVKGMRIGDSLSGGNMSDLSEGEKLLASFLPGSQRSGEQKTPHKAIGNHAVIDMDGATGANEIFMSTSARMAHMDEGQQMNEMNQVDQREELDQKDQVMQGNQVNPKVEVEQASLGSLERQASSINQASSANHVSPANQASLASHVSPDSQKGSAVKNWAASQKESKPLAKAGSSSRKKW